MAYTPYNQPGSPESSTEKVIKDIATNSVARLMSLSDVYRDGIYDWSSFQAAVESHLAERFPGEVETINRITIEVIRTFQEAERHDF